MRYFYIIFVSFFCVFITYLFLKLFNKTQVISNYNIENDLTLDFLLEKIKEDFNILTRDSIDDLNLSSVIYEKEIKKRSKILYSLKKCVYGSLNDKNYIKDVIYDLLDKKYIDNNNINDIVNFNSPSFLSAIDMFDIILYFYKKLYGKDAFIKFINENIDFSVKDNFEISEDDIKKIYQNMNIYLNYEDKLKIITQKIYQKYKGFSVIDELRDMNIDGISGGVSGVLEEDDIENLNKIKKIPKNYDSIWIFYKGKSIHLSFLSFGNYNELKRVCQNIYRYNNIGMLSNNVGYKVNDMIDGSRVVVVRPDFAESWAFFVRKFNSNFIDLQTLIKGKNSNFVINMIDFLAKGNCITSITGAQASGKTTLLMAMIGKIYPSLNIRVQEMSFELNLRKLYPNRNILSFRETPNISGQKGLDLQKKTDGSVQIIGEVATDDVAAWMIQSAQVASNFTIFTHHAKTVNDLIMSIRNSLLKTNVFSNEDIAKEQVISVLNFDIHLTRDYSGKRYIERITEIVLIDNCDENYIYEKQKFIDEYKNLKILENEEELNFKENNVEDEQTMILENDVKIEDKFLKKLKETLKNDKLNQNIDENILKKEILYKIDKILDEKLEKKGYFENNIIVYENNNYKFKNNISFQRFMSMRKFMVEEDKSRFDKFYMDIEKIIERS